MKKRTYLSTIVMLLICLSCQGNIKENNGQGMPDSGRETSNAISCTTGSTKDSTVVVQRKTPPHGDIVDRTKQIYSYEEMLEDLQVMQEVWPECIRFEMRSETYQGRGIPVVYLGNHEAQYHVMVQAAMHAREYMSAQLVMSMLEYYVRNHETGNFNGQDLKQLLEDVCFVIIPMTNPDGVEIAQRGEVGAVTADVKEWVKANTKAGIKHDQIKSNARGVDINRNFHNGFGKDRKRKPSKNYSHYPGKEPLTEVESNLLMEVAQEREYACFLNYHTCGNLVYHGCKNAPKQVNDLALKMANIIKRHTAYPLYGSDTSPECGSWGDEVEVRFHRPSATIELGTKNPVPLSEFKGLYNKNLWVWAELAIAIIEGKFETK
jgi:g-D-glutamyl-meso-diaminopimelate peptidase